MKRAHRKSLTWFRVHLALSDSRKYLSLNLSRRGALQSLWLLAYANRLNVGFLPDLKIIGAHLGPGFTVNSRRVKEIINYFVQTKWIDEIPSEDGKQILYKLHDWETAQFCLNQTQQVVEDISPDESLENVSTSGQQVVEVPVEIVVANNGVADVQSIQRYIYNNNKELSSRETDDFENLVNSSPVEQLKLLPNTLQETVHDVAYRDLLKHIEASWESERKVSLKLLSGKSDYVELHRMLRRVLPAMIPVSALLAAWNRFLLSPDKWNRKQGHPIRYWCNNLAAFLDDDTGNQAPRRESRSEQAYRESLALMAQLDAAERAIK